MSFNVIRQLRATGPLDQISLAVRRNNGLFWLNTASAMASSRLAASHRPIHARLSLAKRKQNSPAFEFAVTTRQPSWSTQWGGVVDKVSFAAGFCAMWTLRSLYRPSDVNFD